MLLIPIEIVVEVKEGVVEAVDTEEEDVAEVVEDVAEAVDEEVVVMEEVEIGITLWEIGVHVQESTTTMNGANYPMINANEFMTYVHLPKAIVLLINSVLMEAQFQGTLISLHHQLEILHLNNLAAMVVLQGVIQEEQ